jgi:PIN domain nuclease of toxin-antitoxin system
VFLSAAVVWEVAIKRSLGKLVAPPDLADTLIGAGVSPLAITVEHAAAVEALPWHHRDPFDRLPVAQATIERCAIVTHDDALRAYGADVIW